MKQLRFSKFLNLHNKYNHLYRQFRKVSPFHSKIIQNGDLQYQTLKSSVAPMAADGPIGGCEAMEPWDYLWAMEAYRIPSMAMHGPHFFH